MTENEIVVDTSEMTFSKVEQFIDCLPISKMDAHELKSLVSDLEQDTHLRAYKDGYDHGYSDGHACGINKVEHAMYHQCFECDNPDTEQKWESGNWFRYKLFEKVISSITTRKE